MGLSSNLDKKIVDVCSKSTIFFGGSSACAPHKKAVPGLPMPPPRLKVGGKISQFAHTLPILREPLSHIQDPESVSSIEDFAARLWDVLNAYLSDVLESTLSVL